MPDTGMKSGKLLPHVLAFALWSLIPTLGLGYGSGYVRTLAESGSWGGAYLLIGLLVVVGFLSVAICISAIVMGLATKTAWASIGGMVVGFATGASIFCPH